MSYPIQQSHLSKQQKLFRDDHEQNCCCHYRIPGLIFQRHKLQHSYQNHVCQIFKIEKRTNQVKPFQSRKRGCYQQGASKELILLKQYDSGFNVSAQGPLMPIVKTAWPSYLECIQKIPFVCIFQVPYGTSLL